LGQIQQRGVLVGAVYTVGRIVRCNPWSQGGVDEVKSGFGFFQVSEKGYVVPKKG
jgi:putative component of membrane protein insertase Oxa1/YidC/SpoIIIJ protein YidD